MCNGARFNAETLAVHMRGKNVGEVLDLLDELKIADNTFVMYSTDNGRTWTEPVLPAMTPMLPGRRGSSVSRQASSCSRW